MGKPTLPPSPLAKANKAPTAIALSSIAVSENAEGAQVGIIKVTDPNKKETFTFSLSDNRFEIVTNAQGQFVLQLKSGVSLDYETEPPLALNVTVTDSGGLTKTQSFSLGVINVNEAPTDVSLTNGSVDENAVGAVIGMLSGSDPEHDALSFSVIGTEASRFEAVRDPISGDWSLRLKAGVSLDYEQEHSINITVRAFDGSLSYDKELAITVNDQGFIGTERISVASDGEQANSGSRYASISADERYLAYESNASNLVDGDTNGAYDIFVFDRETKTTERISVASDGEQGNSGSFGSSISADGRYVAYHSEASNLVEGDTNNTFDVFVFDRETQTTERISVASDGEQANSGSGSTSISADGRYVTYASNASNLVDGDVNGSFSDIFVFDRETHTTERVSVASDGEQANGGSSSSPSISADGRYVTYTSDASNLVDGDTNGAYDIFVFDRETQTTERISVASDGEQGNSGSFGSSISADGRYVAYHSEASNLVEGDTNNTFDVFVFDRETQTTERISVASDGEQANSGSGSTSISADGRYVTYVSNASNLVDGDTNGTFDIFVFDRETRTTARISTANDGTQGNGDSNWFGEPSISSDGGLIAYSSYASNLVEGDTNNVADIFVAQIYDYWWM